MSVTTYRPVATLMTCREDDEYAVVMIDAYRKLQAENAALKQRILDDNKAYGCELRDPSGTIWDYAKRLQAENEVLREDKERMDWLSKQSRVDYSISYWRNTDPKTLRAAIDAARKEAQP